MNITRYSRCILPLLLCFALTSCCAPCRTKARREVDHVVLFWLKDGGNAEQQKQIIAASDSFTSIPGVISVSAGTMIPSERSIVDSSFDVGIVVSCKDKTAMENYLAHPIHVTAVKQTLKPLVAKIVVYDFYR